MAVDPRDAAEALRKRLRTRVEAIRNDARLSDDAKVADIAREYATAVPEMAALKQRFADEIVDGQRDLERRVFGAPGKATSPEGKAAIDASYRDAVERAEKCRSGGECLRILRRANQMDDEAMARACVMVAADKGWSDVIEAYGETRPAAADAIRELAVYRSQVSSTAFQSSQFFTWTLSKPVELSAMSSWQINEIAGR